MRVTLIEDDPFVRDLLHRMFQRNGFDPCDAGPCVRPAVVNDCALQCCCDSVTPDLVVAAILVPRCCSGVEAARKALVQWPGAKILLTSASPRSAWPPDAQALLSSLPPGSYSFLPKPFTISQLRDAVDRLLEHTD